MLGLQMPHHENPAFCVNFGDSGGSFDSGNGFWVASHARDGLAQYTALNHSRGHNIFSLAWYDATVKPQKPTSANHFKHFDLDWMVARTGYTEDDIVLAMRSGKPSNHEHADRNSVILKAYGEILLADPKRHPYDNRKPSWLLRCSPAHNTVLIDGKGHPYIDGNEGVCSSQASAKIIRSGERDGYVFWASDATQAYQLVDEDVASVTRTIVASLQMPCILILDKLIKKTAPSLFSARYQIENEDGNGSGKVKDDQFEILRPGAKFFARCSGSQGLVLQLDKHPIPSDKGVYPFIEAATSSASKEPFLVTVGLPLKEGEPKPDISITNKGSKWFVKVSHNRKEMHCQILDDGMLPEFEITRLELG